jgi:methionyl-tRNA synthetase
MKKHIFIGVAWPYLNGDLHIGHITGTVLPADIMARYHRLIGNEVLMVSGSDCYGTPITIEAEKRNLPPEQIVEEYHPKVVDLFLNVLKTSFDLYTLTANPVHQKVTQEFFISLLEKDLIVVDSSNQFYSEDEERFLPDRYVVGECPHCGNKESDSDQCEVCGKLIDSDKLINPKSKLTGSSVILKETQHYYVAWSKLQPFLEDYYSDVSENWRNWVSSETKSWFTKGLQKRAITRDLDWGIPIPKDRIPKEKLIDNIDKKRIYVWFDAVIGYYSASVKWSKDNNKDISKFWNNSEDSNKFHYYFMGKDNLPFHTMFWPGQLHGYNPDLHLPDNVVISNYLNLGNKKFSKSKNRIIRPKELVDAYGLDATRFYLALIMPENKDSSFVWSDFEEKVNGVLVANIGNYIHRILSLSKHTKQLNFDINFQEVAFSQNPELHMKRAFEALEKANFKEYLNTLIHLSKYGNKRVDQFELWNLRKTNQVEFDKEISNHLYIIWHLGKLLTPLTIDASKKLSEYLDTDFSKEFDSSFIKNFKVDTKFKPLFKKVELKDVHK